jgi:8-oxo-dGTP pyrophosphatase MutT (NUDIX family)
MPTDVTGIIKPATPLTPHLVSRVALIDPSDGSTLLVDHINAQRWVSPGGHVEPDEHPADAAHREAQEELGISPGFADPDRRASFITISETVAIDHGHTDISLLWFFIGHKDMPLITGPSEFTEARWWTHQEVLADSKSLDPHYRRFVAKITS